MAIEGFHAHIYFDETELAQAQGFARKARENFGVPVGHFHTKPVGPHPRGSCQLTLRTDDLGPFALWAMENRGDLTLFVHGLSGNDLEDHTQHVIWLGRSEPLDLTIFD